MPHEFIQHQKEDHNKQLQLADRLCKASSSQEREKLRKEFWQELYPHVIGEEKSMYKVLTKAKDKMVREHALESLEEHKVAKYALAQFMKCSLEGDVFQAKASVLKELNKHHTQEEEEQSLKDLEKMCDAKQLDEIFAQYEKAEKEAKKSKK